jgi:hypothetical protein
LEMTSEFGRGFIPVVVWTGQGANHEDKNKATRSL